MPTPHPTRPPRRKDGFRYAPRSKVSSQEQIGAGGGWQDDSDSYHPKRNNSPKLQQHRGQEYAEELTSEGREWLNDAYSPHRPGFGDQSQYRNRGLSEEYSGGHRSPLADVPRGSGGWGDKPAFGRGGREAPARRVRFAGTPSGEASSERAGDPGWWSEDGAGEREAWEVKEESLRLNGRGGGRRPTGPQRRCVEMGDTLCWDITGLLDR